MSRENLGQSIVAEIEKRGGETEIVGKYGTETLRIIDVVKSDRRKVAFLKAEGWRQYSRSFGARRASLAYLGGKDDSGWWAVRVPGTISNAADALSWLRPAVVKAALLKGRRRVLRQGDVYFVMTGSKANDFGALPTSHQVGLTDDWSTVKVLHEGHEPLLLKGLGWKSVPQNAYQMGRSGRRGYGD